MKKVLASGFQCWGIGAEVELQITEGIHIFQNQVVMGYI